MGLNTLTYALSKKYTDDSVSGISGTLAGKNCTIQSIVYDSTNSKNTVTFKWTADDGTAKTDTMEVFDGKEIVSATVDANNHIIFTFSDTSTVDAGEMPLEPVKVSAESGNAAVMKADGIYVSSTGVQVSAETGNTLVTKADGLFVPATDISGKVDKVAGKGLSTVDFTDASYVHTDNNYTTAEKTAVGTIADKVDKVTGKDLSTNDYDDASKAKVDAIPSDPKYTDTVYDDTAITQELANIYDGGFASRNLFDKNAITPNVKYATDGTTVGDANWGIELIKVEPNTKYAITSSTATGYFIEFDSSKTFIKGYTKKSQIITTSSNCEYLGVGIVVNSTLANYDLDTFQIEKGDVATSYQPYAKSNVELTHATNDDLKMLGWTVPSECPIQNYTDANGVFHQRVGRVDLGTLTWSWGTYVTDTWNYTLSSYKSNGATYTTNYNKTAWSSNIQVGQYMTTNNYIVVNNGSDTTKPSGYLYYELATEVTKSDGNEIGTNLCGFISPSKISSIQVDANWDSSNRTISYTATENCFVVGRFATNGTNLSINVKIDDYLIQRLGHVVTNAIVHENPITIPLRKGQVFKIEVSITNGSTFASLNAVKMI